MLLVRKGHGAGKVYHQKQPKTLLRIVGAALRTGVSMPERGMERTIAASSIHGTGAQKLGQRPA
jgi:hypothetical protein